MQGDTALKLDNHTNPHTLHCRPHCPGMPAGRRACWSQKHFSEAAGGRKCKFCDELVKATSGTRMKAHLRLCEKISSAAKDELKAERYCADPRQSALHQEHTEGKALPKIARMLNACPTPTVAEKDAIVAAWARFFFGSGTPFSHVEDKLFLEALNATRPGLSPELFFPKRHSLGTKWLDRIHKEEAEPQMKDLLAAAHIAIMCDVWKNDRSEKVFAVTAIGDGSPVLLQSGVLSEKRHRATEFLGHLKKIHEQVLGKIVAILVDGDSTAVASAILFKAFQTEAGRQTPFVCICACHTVARALNDCIRGEDGKEARGEERVPLRRRTSLCAVITIAQRRVSIQNVCGETTAVRAPQIKEDGEAGGDEVAHVLNCVEGS